MNNSIITAKLITALGESMQVHSSPNIIRKDPFYQRLVAEGVDLVPMLITALQSGQGNPIVMMLLLEDVTGAQPALHPAHTESAITSWLTWYKTHGRDLGHKPRG